ncbi:MAG TPA: PTS sugar transporter subunit IIA [Casimicrobiaceae bacterium]|jgi:PTS system nitrogen regulatory IIA component
MQQLTSFVHARSERDRIREDAAACARAVLHRREWLRPESVLLDVDASDGKRVLRLAANHFASGNTLHPDVVFRALWRREQVGSTALGTGIAIPHARIPGISRPLTLFMRTREAVAFDAPDGKPISEFLVIMVSADGDTDDHLQLLAMVAARFSNRAFRALLDASATPSQVTTLFSEWDGDRHNASTA